MDQVSEFTELEIQEFLRCFNKDRNYWGNYSLYGPANPMRKNPCDPNDNHVCKYTPTGICHMMTCKCHMENADDVKDNDWYTGYCCSCEIKISDRTKAWRISHKNGGFDGCYCSDEHMEEQFIVEEDEEYIALIKVMKAVRLKFPIIRADIEAINNSKVEEPNNFDM